MALIKNAHSGSMAREAVVLDLGDLAAQAAAIIERAEREAAQVRDEARAERERLIADAHEIGFKQGIEAGQEQGRRAGYEEGKIEALNAMQNQLTELDARWSMAVEEFESRRQRLIIESRTDVLRLAVGIAERITRRRVAIDATAVEAQIEAALQYVLEPTRLVVRVHQEDVEAATLALPRLLARLSASPHIDVRPDDSLTRGDCIVETRGGEIDARIETQLERIVTSLLPQRPNEAPIDPPAKEPSE